MLVDLNHYGKKKQKLLFTKMSHSPSIVIFIGGMLSNLMQPKFVYDLADKIDFAKFVQPMLRSHPLFGQWTLDDDADDIEEVIDYVFSSFLYDSKDIDKTQVILVGHSTGCQSILHYLNTKEQKGRVARAVLLGPVSDREYEESRNKNLQENLRIAESDPKAIFPLHQTEINAERYLSLFKKHGDDDIFSSDLPEGQFLSLNRSGTPLHFVVMRHDECVVNSNVEVLKKVNDAEVIEIDNDHMFRKGIVDVVDILRNLIIK